MGAYYNKSPLANTREKPIYAGEVAFSHLSMNYHLKPAKNALQSEPDLVDFPATGTSEKRTDRQAHLHLRQGGFPALCATVG